MKRTPWEPSFSSSARVGAPRPMTVPSLGSVLCTRLTARKLPAPGHVAGDDGRSSGDVLAEVARQQPPIGIVAAAGRIADLEIKALALVELLGRLGGALAGEAEAPPRERARPGGCAQDRAGDRACVLLLLPAGLPAAGSSGQLRAFSHDGEKPARCRGAESPKISAKRRATAPNANRAQPTNAGYARALPVAHGGREWRPVKPSMRDAADGSVRSAAKQIPRSNICSLKKAPLPEHILLEAWNREPIGALRRR